MEITLNLAPTNSTHIVIREGNLCLLLKKERLEGSDAQWHVTLEVSAAPAGEGTLALGETWMSPEKVNPDRLEQVTHQAEEILALVQDWVIGAVGYGRTSNWFLRNNQFLRESIMNRGIWAVLKK